jgi:two-component system alkaline phosphatase synthesis response regulator PhoP
MIYLLEDDDSIRKLVVYTLSSQGLEAQGFEKPSQFWKAVGQALPELILLDIMLPEEDGLSVLKKLRSGAATKGYTGHNAHREGQRVRQGDRP